MNDKHPMDSVPMPEPTGAMDVDAGPFMHLRTEIGRKTKVVDAYSKEQLRAYGLSAYEMGRNAGLEEAAKSLKQHGYSEGAIDAIRSLKR